jgi:hypothetical protein
MNKFERLIGFRFLTIISFLFTISCGPREIAVELGQVKFGINKPASIGGRVNETFMPAYVLLSITDATDHPVETDRKIALYSFGASYVSESLQLKTGGYKISKFLVLDASNKIIYASPLGGSPQAKYVTNPLPMNFTVAENGSTLVTPQVLQVVDGTTPDIFGYASFGFEVVGSVTKKLKEVIVNASDPYKIKYTYNEDRVIKAELQYPNELSSAWWNYSYNNDQQLVKTEYFQDNKIFEAKLFSYNEKGQLIYVDGDHNEELFYSADGLVTEMKLTPGNFSHHETAIYEYDSRKNVSKIVIHGFNEFNEEKWSTTERYFYDNRKVLSGNRAANFYQDAISYLLFHVNYFSQIHLNNNPVRLEYSTYANSNGNTLPNIKTFYSEFEYNEVGLPIKEKIFNPSLGAYYPANGLVKEFIYE